MITPLLATKLYVPPLRRDYVPRPRLLARLAEGLERRLVLVSAPAGFGKTTLLSEWLLARRRPPTAHERPSVAWLSLDAEDNDLARFLRYLVAALAPAAPEVDEAAASLLRLPQMPPTEIVLTSLINGLCSLPADLVLVLEDYHTIENRSIHSALTFLLDNLPPQVHLVISTRADPPLPLSRWRSRGLMVEIHEGDLRFTTEESAAYLNDTMNLRLLPEDVAALNQRTEGWIVGLQMVALTLRGKNLEEEASAFVRAFSGSHHYILDYLVEEVLSQQSQEVQAFLLQTSILSRLTGPLCDAICCGQAATDGDKAESQISSRGTKVDGQEMLEALDAANLFLVPLDDERRWYRYHHLFAEVLRARLRRTVRKEGTALLHARAAAWYEDRGEANEAFRHAVAGGDFERAARLIEDNWLRVGHAGQMNTVLGWFEAMPEEVVRARPVLCGAYAWVLWLTGRMDAVESYLDAAAEAGERQAAAGTIDPLYARWQAAGPALRTNLARHRGHLEEAVHYAHQTLDLAAPDDPLLRSYGHLGLAHAYRELGDYPRSAAAYVEGLPLARAAGNLAAASLTAFYLCRVLQLQGHLHQAAEAVREALQFADSKGMGQSPACAILHIAQANLLCEWGELLPAREHLHRGQELARLSGHHELLRNGRIVQARLRLAQGDPASALAAIQGAEEATAKAEMPLTSAELAAHKARIRLAQGDLAAATRWAGKAAQRPGQDRGYTRQLEAITLARVLSAQAKLAQALNQLAACWQAADESGGLGWGVEIGILKALVREARGERAEAVADLERALIQAEPEGYVQVFLDEGQPLTPLLRRVASSGSARAYARRLLDALECRVAQQQPAAASGPSPLVEPLTKRELEVLGLMAAGLSNREIAGELVLAMGTVKAHLHNIYGKLGVRGRTQAAARARELDLL
jgi:LuxR family maltose regulon positive regulatory protein